LYSPSHDYLYISIIELLLELYRENSLELTDTHHKIVGLVKISSFNNTGPIPLLDLLEEQFRAEVYKLIFFSDIFVFLPNICWPKMLEACS
jgi:hypothetical protein